MLNGICLDKGYNSEQEEQELIKRGYVLHIPIKGRERKEERIVKKKMKKRCKIAKNIHLKDGL